MVCGVLLFSVRSSFLLRLKYSYTKHWEILHEGALCLLIQNCFPHLDHVTYIDLSFCLSFCSLEISVLLCNCLSPVRDPSEEKNILLVLPECEQTCLIFLSASRGDSVTKISPHTRGNGWTKCLARHFSQLFSHVCGGISFASKRAKKS